MVRFHFSKNYPCRFSTRIGPVLLQKHNSDVFEVVIFK